MSLSDRKEQVRRLQEKLKKGDELDVAAEFDDLVDYLESHGYEIVKRGMPPTTKERTEEHNAELEGARSVHEIERSIKEAIQTLDASPEAVWRNEIKEAIERARAFKRDRDFAEAINYIKAAHSITKQLQDNE